MAELLGFPDFLRNSYGCIASSDYTAGVYAALKVMALEPRPLCAGHGVLDLVRGRPAAVLGRLRADQFDHAAEAQSRARRAPAPHGLALRRQVRRGADRAPQHAVHRHERQRARGARARLRSLRHGGARPDPAARGGRPPRRSTRRRARANIEASYATITELADTIVREESLPFSVAHHVAAESRQGTCRASGETLVHRALRTPSPRSSPSRRAARPTHDRGRVPARGDARALHRGAHASGRPGPGGAGARAWRSTPAETKRRLAASSRRIARATRRPSSSLAARSPT